MEHKQSRQNSYHLMRQMLSLKGGLLPKHFQLMSQHLACCISGYNINEFHAPCQFLVTCDFRLNILLNFSFGEILRIRMAHDKCTWKFTSEGIGDANNCHICNTWYLQHNALKLSGRHLFTDNVKLDKYLLLYFNLEDIDSL